MKAEPENNPHQPGESAVLAASIASDDMLFESLSTPERYNRLVLRLQKQVIAKEQELLALQNTNRVLEKRTRVQRRLVDHLRARLVECKSASVAVTSQSESTADRQNGQRVASLDSALMRISGVEPKEIPNPQPVVRENIDPAEFLPIQDLPLTVPARLLQACRQVTKMAAALVTRVLRQYQTSSATTGR